jgi:hypothetical protein
MKSLNINPPNSNNMKFMLSIHGDNLIASAMSRELHNIGAQLINTDRCNCRYFPKLGKKVIAINATEGADVIIYHPSRDTSRNYLDCWEVHQAIIDANPKQKFYVFAKFNPAIEEFLGKRDNVRYLNHDNTKEIWDEIVQLARK